MLRGLRQGLQSLAEAAAACVFHRLSHFAIEDVCGSFAAWRHAVQCESYSESFLPCLYMYGYVYSSRLERGYCLLREGGDGVGLGF